MISEEILAIRIKWKSASITTIQNEPSEYKRDMIVLQAETAMQLAVWNETFLKATEAVRDYLKERLDGKGK